MQSRLSNIKNIIMKLGKIITILFISIYFAACSQNETVKQVPPKDFSMLLDNIKDAQLIDVRTPEEYKEKHLKNAVNMNINDAAFESQIEKLDKSKPVFVYCLSGGRSTKAANLLAQKGFKDVFNMQGGIMAWSNEKLPLLIEKQNAANGMGIKDYTAELNKHNLVLVDFSAVWCGPCKMLKPILKNLEAKNKEVKIWQIDVDKNPQLSSDMQIKGIPLIILYKNGKEVWRSNGFADEATIQAAINKNK